MSWEGLNRRQFPRAKYPCMVKVLSHGDAPESILTHTENVSNGGICVILRKSLQCFDKVDIEIDLMDGEEHIACWGKAVWVVRRKATDPLKPSWYDIGIEYVDMSSENRKRIERLVAQITRNEGKAKL